MSKKRKHVKDSATIFRSYIEAVEGLSEEDKKEWFFAIINRLFYGHQPNFKRDQNTLSLMWKLVEPNLNTSISRSYSASNNKNKIKTKQKQNKNKTKTNQNQNENKHLLEDKDKDKDIYTPSGAYIKKEPKGSKKSPELSGPLQAAFQDWMEYKYASSGRETNAVTKQKQIEALQAAAEKYGDAAVVKQIEKAIMSEWKGLYLDGIEQKKQEQLLKPGEVLMDGIPIDFKKLG